MNMISGSGCAAFAICLAFLQPASAQVNAETDARAFIVREAEIRRQVVVRSAGVLTFCLLLALAVNTVIRKVVQKPLRRLVRTIEIPAVTPRDTTARRFR